MNDPQRVAWMTEPGMALFPASSLSVSMSRAGLAGEESGLGPEYWVYSPLLQIPVPVPDAVGQRWSGVSPEYLRLPLFWLPDDLAAPVVYHREDGSTFDESVNAWLLRVGLELMLSDLYDEETGSWFDALANHGIDPNEEGFSERYRIWAGGNPDEGLDAISLDDHLVGDRDLVFDLADAIYDDATQVGAVVTASSLRADLADLMADEESLETVKQVLDVVAGLIGENLADHLPPNRNSEDFVWLLQQVSVGGPRATNINQVQALVDEVDSWLGEVEAAYSPAFGRLGEFFDELASPQA